MTPSGRGSRPGGASGQQSATEEKLPQVQTPPSARHHARSLRVTSEVGSPERTLAAEVTFRADVTAGARIGPTFGQRAASQGRSVKHDMARAAKVNMRQPILGLLRRWHSASDGGRRRRAGGPR